MAWYVHFLSVTPTTFVAGASKVFDTFDDAQDHAILHHTSPGWALVFPQGCNDKNSNGRPTYPRLPYAANQNVLLRRST